MRPLAAAFPDAMVAQIPMLRAFAAALLRCGASRCPEADDLVQETLARAWRYRDSFRDDSNMASWLRKILQNCFYHDAVRRRLTVQDVEGRCAASQAIGPAQEWRVRLNELIGTLDTLHPQTRQALLLIAADGLSYEDAAREAGCPVGTLKSRVKRARGYLARHLDVPVADGIASEEAYPLALPEEETRP
jgi:RNA polymerase sigma-70 factor (ECF subfamily)